MKQNTDINYEQMDPDFGRHAAVGEGLGEHSEEAYEKLLKEVSEQMDPDFGRHMMVGDGLGEHSEEAYEKLLATLEEQKK